MYSNLFISKFGVEDNGTWFECLRDLTPKAMENGLETLRTGGVGGKYSEFPPNPVQFRELCLAYYESLRLPSVGLAYQELRGYSNQPHPAVQFTAKKLGSDFLNIEDEREAYAQFKKTYQKVCHLVRMGHRLPDSPAPLFLEKPRNKSLALASLRNIKQLLGGASCTQSHA